MIERYDLVTKGGYVSYQTMDPDPHGDWCRWDDVEAELKRMQAVVDAASLLTDAIEDLAGKGCATYKATHNAAMTGEAGGPTTLTVRTIADDRLFVEVLRNANLVKTKLDAAREGKR